MTAQAQVDIKFLSFNVWQEGTSVTNGLNKIRDVIIKAGPDIVSFSEVRNYSGDWTTRIQTALAALGHTYNRGYVTGSDVSILSKFPITSSGSLHATVSRFGISVNGNPITVVSTHLDYTFYACYLPRGYNGGSPNWNMIDDGNGNPAPVTNVSQILSYNLLSTRDEAIRALTSYSAARTEPLVVLGDFNEPSHLDWTARTQNLFDHHNTVVSWTSTKSLDSAGFTDAFREAYPDEVANPGISWPSFADGMPPTTWTPRADERDRIDFILYKGAGITTRLAALVGPKNSYAFNAITATFTVNETFLCDSLPWPSDHKAVFATLRFTFTPTPITRKIRSVGFKSIPSRFMLNGVKIQNPSYRNEKPQAAMSRVRLP